jgi:hypothetical protein
LAKPAVLRMGDEYQFPYLTSIIDYWTGLCAVNRVASRQGGGELDEKAMLYIIGISFSAEMIIKGTYEDSLGRLFVWLRGPGKTNEDRFAASVADEYATFLNQRPWYEFAFLDQVRRLWRNVPFDRANVLRASERRAALTMEWSGKSVYAALIGLTADLSPAPLQIDSVVVGLDASDRAAVPAITVLRELGEGRQLIRTPRYAEFTQILGNLAARDRQILEIAGNTRIFVTVLVPPGVDLGGQDLRPMFSDPVEVRRGWQRQGFEVAVPSLTATIQQFNAHGALFEHAYDY